MNKWLKYKNEAESFLQKLEVLQEKMLHFDLDNLQKEFNRLYLDFMNYVQTRAESLDVKEKKSKEFLLKKQIHLIVRNLDNFIQQNKNLPAFKDIEILNLFEKQYKLKQILRKQIRDHSG